MMNQIWQEMSVDATFAEDSRAWLSQRARERNLPNLLAFAHDGVIWGRFSENNRMVVSGDLFSEIAVELRYETLLQARLFGPSGELFIWRTDDGFAARLIADGADKPEDACDEVHWLWGRGIKTGSTEDVEFTLMHEGQQGFRHAPPVANAHAKRLGLKIRQYIDYDDQGQAYFALSRLVDLEIVEEERNA